MKEDNWTSLNEWQLRELCRHLGLETRLDSFRNDRKWVDIEDIRIREMPVINGGKYRVIERKDGITFELKIERGIMHCYSQSGSKRTKVYEPHNIVYKRKIKFKKGFLYC